MFDWLEHILTALLGGGVVGIAALLKIRADNRATNASATKTEQEAGTEMVDQAKAVVQMWQEIGQSLRDKVKDLETRVDILEASEKAKTARIQELEQTIAAKDKRISELEREVVRLQDEVDHLKQAQGIFP
jgi:predicted RNase H-like nuclease (RuvC/YqgF family)